MVVGTAVSELVDPAGNRLEFGSAETGSKEGHWYRGLTGVQDKIGSIKDLKLADALPTESFAKPENNIINIDKAKQAQGPKAASSRIVSIEEISDGSESDADDLPMYEKPDSDPSDDDEDPTLVQRDRPTAPV